MNVAQLYDAFSPLIPLSLEGYGFCERGEGGRFTDDGALEWPDGRLPTNTAGGGMSEAYVHGFNLVLEGVRQIRGTSTSQVDGADVSPRDQRRGRAHERAPPPEVEDHRVRIPAPHRRRRAHRAVLGRVPRGELLVQRFAESGRWSGRRVRCARRPLARIRVGPGLGPRHDLVVHVPHPPLLPAYAELAPYNVIVVALDEDPTIRIVGNLVESAEAPLNRSTPTVEIGEPVQVVFAQVEDMILPRWVRA